MQHTKIIYLSNKVFKKNKLSLPLIIGYFNCIHKGHMQLFKGLQPYKFNILTFQTFKNKQHDKIYNFTTRISLLTNLKPNKIYIFDIEKFNTSSIDFINQYLFNINPSTIIVGSNFYFGNDHMDGTFLAKYFHVNQIKVNDKYQTKIIRQLLSNSQINQANELLQKPFFCIGKWAKGDKNGRKIGFPTINLQINSGHLPCLYGSYIVKIKINKKVYNAVAFYGKSPSIKNNNTDNTLEVHVMGKKIWNRFFYPWFVKNNIVVTFLSFISIVKKFNNVDDLKNKISNDINQATKYFNLTTTNIK